MKICFPKEVLCDGGGGAGGLGVGQPHVSERPYTAGVGGVPPTPPGTPLPPFQGLGLTAKIVLQRLRHQDDSSPKNFGLPLAGTIGGPKEEGSPSQTSLTPPPPPRGGPAAMA